MIATNVKPVNFNPVFRLKASIKSSIEKSTDLLNISAKFPKIGLDPFSLSSLLSSFKKKQTQKKKKNTHPNSAISKVAHLPLRNLGAGWAINQAPPVRRTTERERERKVE